MLEKAVAHPGYVRLILGPDDAPRDARAAGRRFAKLCREEDASRGLIVAGTAAAGVDWDDALAASGAGFRLALVVRGSESAHVARAAFSAASRRSAVARLFKSEHRAAAWLMG